MLSRIKKNIKPFLPLIILFIGILAISSSSILIRYSQENVPSLTIAVYRLAIAAAILAPVAFRHHRAEICTLPLSDIRLLLLAALFLAIHFAAWITSLEYTSVISSVVLVTTTPIWVACYSIIKEREAIQKPLLLGLALVLLGGFTVSFSHNPNSGNGLHLFRMITPGQFDQSVMGNLLALCGAFCAAGYLIIGKKMRARTNIVSYTFLVYGMAAFFLLLLTLAGKKPIIGFLLKDYLFLIALAVIPQLIGHTIFNWALAYLSVTYVSIALLGEPVGTSILAFFLLNETPSWLEFIGGILVLSGLLAASKAEKPVGNINIS